MYQEKAWSATPYINVYRYVLKKACALDFIFKICLNEREEKLIYSSVFLCKMFVLHRSAKGSASILSRKGALNKGGHMAGDDMGEVGEMKAGVESVEQQIDQGDSKEENGSGDLTAQTEASQEKKVALASHDPESYSAVCFQEWGESYSLPFELGEESGPFFSELTDAIGDISNEQSQDASLKNDDVEKTPDNQNVPEDIREDVVEEKNNDEENKTNDEVRSRILTIIEKIQKDPKVLREKLQEFQNAFAGNFGPSLTHFLETKANIKAFFDFLFTGQFYDIEASSLGYQEKHEVENSGKHPIGVEQIASFTSESPINEAVMIIAGFREAWLISEDQMAEWKKKITDNPQAAIELITSDLFRSKLKEGIREGNHENFHRGILKHMNLDPNNDVITIDAVGYIQMTPKRREILK